MQSAPHTATWFVLMGDLMPTMAQQAEEEAASSGIYASTASAATIEATTIEATTLSSVGAGAISPPT